VITSGQRPTSHDEATGDAMKDHIALVQAEVQEHSDPSSFRMRIAGCSAWAANVRRVWTPSSEAATGMIEGLPQYQ
jgi:hypothetical protein